MSTLRIHATATLAVKLGGFTKPVPEQDSEALILDSWYANLSRRRRPRVLLMNPATLLTVTVPLAPAKTIGERLPVRVASELRACGAPPDFIEEHVTRLFGAADVVKTESRQLGGILNQRMQYVNHWRLGDDDDEWMDREHWMTNSLTLADIPGPSHGRDRLALAFDTWERTGVASITE